MLHGNSFTAFGNTLASSLWMHAQPIRFTNSLRILLLRSPPVFSGLFIYSINRPATNFPRLLFQTRYGTNCFAKQAIEGGAREHLPSCRTFVAFLLTNHAGRQTPRGATQIRTGRPARCPDRANSSPRAAILPTLPFKAVGRTKPAEVRPAQSRIDAEMPPRILRMD